MSGVGGILHTLGGPDWVDRALLITVLVAFGFHVVTKRLENLEYVQTRHKAIMSFRGVVRRNRNGKAKLYEPGILKYIPGFNRLHQANMMLRMRPLKPLIRKLHGGYWLIEVEARYEVADPERSLLTSELPDEQVVAVCSAALQKLDLRGIQIDEIPHRLPNLLMVAAQHQVSDLGFRIVDILVDRLEPTYAYQLGDSLTGASVPAILTQSPHANGTSVTSSTVTG